MIDILAFGSHPDDMEFGCGGILAAMAAEGKSITMVDLTLGDKGTNGTPEIRKKESENAAAVIGAKRLFLDFKDCEIFDSYENRLKFVRVIRQEKPKLVLAPMWKGESDHPDHIACGLMARYACRYARFAKILPDLPSHTVQGILHYPPRVSGPPDFLMDITPHVETWKKMMAAHESQMKTRPYLEWNLSHAERMGIYIGTKYAQGLVKGNPIVIEDIMTIAQGTQEI